MPPTPTPSTASKELLSLRDVEKAFFGVRVLKGVSFNVLEGGMLGLVGENGAGKSTLVNILGGNLKPDSGTIHFANALYAPRNPQDAAHCGLAFIHQELNLFPNLSIAENIFLTRFPCASRSPFIRRSLMHERTTALLRQVGLDIPPDRIVQGLSSGERQLVEIAKALSLEARLIVFDEPTTSLSERETARLFNLIAQLRAAGLTLVYISHTLSHVFQLCDDLVVLRDGEVVASGATSSFTPDKLVSLMVGRTLTNLFPQPKPNTVGSQGGVPVLEVRDVSQPGVVNQVSLTLHQGEILGLAGLMGSGRSELARMIFGLAPFQQGAVRVSGEVIHQLSPRNQIRRGMAFLTEDRHREGLCLDGSVADNLALVTLPQHGQPPLGWLSLESVRAAVSRIRSVVRLDTKANDTQPVRTLSGGNQQKVVLGKWLLSQPKVLVLDEPTRGIDVGAKFEIYTLIQDHAAQGAGVLVISSEIEELIGLCDRILVMRQGRLVDDLPRAEFNRERILSAALGSSLEVTA